MFPASFQPENSETRQGNTEELLAEAAMRAALAAEKQAEAVAQAVDILQELVTLLRERVAPPPLPPSLQAPHLPTHHHL